MEALPDQLAGLERREVSPDEALGAAYGDPAIVVVCGGTMPDGFDEFSACDEVNGVGWYAPPAAMQDPADGSFSDVTLGTITAEPLVELTVPSEHRPEGLAAALAELAPYVKENLRQVRTCH